ncbi:hypothetical protein GCM10025857_68540 [Alicyclobacillus contaminans]|nr:hypothetical protein GCM10025857_68540 [Alicyclobacillus contaminans]
MASEEVSSLKVTVNMDTVGFQDGISKINRQLQIAKSEFEAASVHWATSAALRTVSTSKPSH